MESFDDAVHATIDFWLGKVNTSCPFPAKRDFDKAREQDCDPALREDVRFRLIATSSFSYGCQDV